MNTPSRKIACGALGRYDRNRVLAIAAQLTGETSIVHEEQESMLLTDREPIRWEGRTGRGLAWSERVETADGTGIRTWEDAARAGSACGLVIEDGRHFVHSSVSGIAPVYFIEADGAVYFATSVDALAATNPGRLTADWEAWASILTISYPLGDRTPFREIKLLHPFSQLEERGGKARVDEASWPWAEVEPNLDVKAGGPAVVDGLRSSIARLPEGPICCHLSGGLDSRLALGLLAEHRHGDLSALTINPDNGLDSEEKTAATIADSIGVPIQTAAGDSGDFWNDFKLRNLRVDFQFPRAPWRMPMLSALRDSGAISVDGFGFDVLAAAGDRAFTPSAVGSQGSDGTVETIWDGLRTPYERRPAWSLRGGLGRALLASSRAQFFAESERYRGHASRAVLTYYRARQVRGISRTPYDVLGAEVPIATPLIDDDIARAALSLSYESKRGFRLYEEMYAAVAPALFQMPSTRRGTNPEPARMPRRGRSAEIAEAFFESVTNGPLTPWVRGSALRKLTWHRRGKEPRTDRGAIGIMAFHMWCERYRSQLGEVDVAEGFDVARPEP